MNNFLALPHQIPEDLFTMKMIYCTNVFKRLDMNMMWIFKN